VAGRRGRAQDGFTYIEILICILILAIAAGAIFQGFASSSAQVGRARLDSTATSLAQGALERVKGLAYDDVGVAGGNPPGDLPATETRTVGSIDYRLDYAVQYVDDPAIGRPTTMVNYKRVTVTVTPQVPAGKAISQATLLSPPNFGAISGKATAVVTVVDAVTDQVLPGVSVTINGSTSPSRTDVTGADGKVVFAGLLPSDTTVGSPTYQYVVAATLAGYGTHPDTVPAVTRKNLAADQTWQVTVKMYRPASIRVNLLDAATGDPITERSEVEVTTPAPSSTSESQIGYSGIFTFTTLNGQPILPSLSAFTVAAAADCYEPQTKTSPVPVGYPTNVAQTFTFSMVREDAGGWLDLWVVNNATGAGIPGAQVQVSGGESRLRPILRTADSSGYARFCLPTSGTTPYTVSSSATGFGAGSVSAVITANQTTPLTMRLIRSTTGDIRLNAGRTNALVRIRALSGTYDVSQYTNASGYADFINLAAGGYMAYIATGFSSGGDPVWSAGKSVTAAANVRTTYNVP
jgi:prepilin-type N-terminal cleavage/methylation domain-containing protein